MLLFIIISKFKSENRESMATYAQHEQGKAIIQHTIPSFMVRLLGLKNNTSFEWCQSDANHILLD